MEERSSSSALDIAVRVVGAITATFAAYRAARSALSAWQRVAGSFRSDEEPALGTGLPHS